MTAGEPLDSSLQIDGYSDFREIGHGGSAVVYAGWQAQLERFVAIKVLHTSVADGTARRRFDRECAVLGTLSGAPGIVDVYASAVTADGRGCIVMELMRESLAATLDAEGPLPVDRVVRIGTRVAEALGYAHRAGVIHRDVKPANLLMSAYGEVAIGDFDIASIADPVWSTSTQDSMSPPHSSPERLTGESAGDALGDVWSLGSTLWTLLEGRPPFGTARDDGGMAGLVDRVRHEPLPRSSRVDVPADLDAVLRRALAKDPRDRWPDAGAFADALRAIGTGAGSWMPSGGGAGGTGDETVDAAADQTVEVTVDPAAWAPDAAVPDAAVSAAAVSSAAVRPAGTGRRPDLGHRPPRQTWSTIVVVVAVLVALAAALVIVLS